MSGSPAVAWSKNSSPPNERTLAEHKGERPPRPGHGPLTGLLKSSMPLIGGAGRDARLVGFAGDLSLRAARLEEE
jgi:hypothetical protein